MVASTGALASGRDEDCGLAFGTNAHVVPHADWAVGRQSTHKLVEHRSLTPSPPWAGRDGEGRSGSKGGEGPARGGNRFPRSAAHAYRSR